MTRDWYVKRYYHETGKKVSTVLAILPEDDAKRRAEALRTVFHSDQYVAEPYDPSKRTEPDNKYVTGLAHWDRLN